MRHTPAQPVNKELQPYIDGYLQVSWKDGWLTSKEIQPRPGATMIFSDREISMGDQNFANPILLGIQDQALHGKTYGPALRAFIVHFSAFGLSRFTAQPADRFHNQVVDAVTVFDQELSLLSDTLFRPVSIKQQIASLEDYLWQKFSPPDALELAVFRLIHRLLNEDEPISYPQMRREVPMSFRSLERKFRSLVGVSIRKFIRLARFHRAKTLLTEEQEMRLTDIGYDTGYFDQAHFSREFQAFSTLSPKDFLPASPYYRLLAKGNS